MWVNYSMKNKQVLTIHCISKSIIFSVCVFVCACSHTWAHTYKYFTYLSYNLNLKFCIFLISVAREENKIFNSFVFEYLTFWRSLDFLVCIDFLLTN